MKEASVRVMLASERPEMRSFLRKMAEAEDRVVIVGQADNAPKALTLARNLRPDVAIIDSYLPHHNGVDSIPLSRVGGLDTAQIISEEIPNVKVVLLNRPEEILALREYRREDMNMFFCGEVRDSCIPFALGELEQHETLPNRLIFAHVETSARTSSRQRAFRSFSEGAIFFGGCGIVLGILLIITMILALPGAVLALAGAASVLVGLAGRLVGKAMKNKGQMVRGAVKETEG